MAGAFLVPRGHPTTICIGRRWRMDDTVSVVNDNIDEWETASEQVVAHGLEEVGLAAEGYAKALCLVDTGRLRDLVMHAGEGGCFPYMWG